MFKKVAHWFRPRRQEESPKEDGRQVRELLRENLKTLPVDVFYTDDPMLVLSDSERKQYLKFFYDLSKIETNGNV